MTSLSGRLRRAPRTRAGVSGSSGVDPFGSIRMDQIRARLRAFCIVTISLRVFGAKKCPLGTCALIREPLGNPHRRAILGAHVHGVSRRASSAPWSKSGRSRSPSFPRSSARRPSGGRARKRRRLLEQGEACSSFQRAPAHFEDLRSPLPAHEFGLGSCLAIETKTPVFHRGGRRGRAVHLRGQFGYDRAAFTDASFPVIPQFLSGWATSAPHEIPHLLREPMHFNRRSRRRRRGDRRKGVAGQSHDSIHAQADQSASGVFW